MSGKAKSQNENLEVSSHQIILFRDTDGDGQPGFRRVYLDGLKQPFGMLVLDNHFYVANTDGLWRFPYDPEASSIVAVGEKLLGLPAGGYNNHWTRNIVANADGSKIYVSVGSGSNVGENGMENEVRWANILEINPDGTGERVYASGLRNRPSGQRLLVQLDTEYSMVPYFLHARKEKQDNEYGSGDGDKVSCFHTLRKARIGLMLLAETTDG